MDFGDEEEEEWCVNQKMRLEYIIASCLRFSPFVDFSHLCFLFFIRFVWEKREASLQTSASVSLSLPLSKVISVGTKYNCHKALHLV